MYQKILVPLDGSKRAEAILPYVEDLAQHYDAEVIFLQVMEPETVSVTLGPTYDPQFDPLDYQRCLKAIETYLADRQEEFREKGIKAQAQLAHGPPVKAILDVAEYTDTDLIAMASHGRTGLARAFYGSVAAGILHRVDRPLLLIRSL